MTIPRPRKTPEEVLGSLLWVILPEGERYNDVPRLVWVRDSVKSAWIINRETDITWSLSPDLSKTVGRLTPEEWL